MKTELTAKVQTDDMTMKSQRFRGKKEQIACQPGKRADSAVIRFSAQGDCGGLSQHHRLQYKPVALTTDQTNKRQWPRICWGFLPYLQSFIQPIHLSILSLSIIILSFQPRAGMKAFFND